MGVRRVSKSFLVSSCYRFCMCMTFKIVLIAFVYVPFVVFFFSAILGSWWLGFGFVVGSALLGLLPTGKKGHPSA